MATIITRKGQQILVDDEDFEWLSSYIWCVTTEGYAKRSYGPRSAQQQELMHRAILDLAKGDGMDGDHVNGNRLDNRRANLRACTRTQNLSNRRISPRNTSGFKGVSTNKGGRLPWRATIHAQGQQMNLGSFATTDEAAHAYNKAAIAFHGEFAVLNPVGQTY